MSEPFYVQHFSIICYARARFRTQNKISYFGTIAVNMATGLLEVEQTASWWTQIGVECISTDPPLKTDFQFETSPSTTYHSSPVRKPLLYLVYYTDS